MSKKVLITGVTGQDGSYMVDYLLANTQHQLFGMVRYLSVSNHKNIEHNLNNPRFKLVTADLSDYISLEKVIKEVGPDYIINFAANSFVGSSWNLPFQHFDLNCMGVLRILEIIKQHCPTCRFYNAGSSEQFGKVSYVSQDFKHPMHPRSPYGSSKAAAHYITQNYRESFGLYAIHCLCFNHESPRRGSLFISKKTTEGVASIKSKVLKNQPFEPLRLGNLYAKRDWSHALDFCDGIWRALNQDIYSKTWNGIPKEYVFSSDETHSVKEFVNLAFAAAGFSDLIWIGTGLDEKLVDKNGVIYVEINPKFFRPAEVDLLLGNSKATREDLNWSPNFTFNDLVEEMVRFDIGNT